MTVLNCNTGNSVEGRVPAPLQQLHAQLLQAFRGEGDLYQELYLLGRKHQQELRANPQVDIDQLLREKQPHFAHLERMEREIRPLRDQWEAHRMEFSSTQREEMRLCVMELGNLIQTILTVEKENENLLLQQSQAIQSELGQMRNARQAYDAYQPPAGPEARFLDHKE